MIISLTIFLGLLVFLLFSFYNFDKLVKIEYERYKEIWLKDKKREVFLAPFRDLHLFIFKLFSYAAVNFCMAFQNTSMGN